MQRSFLAARSWSSRRAATLYTDAEITVLKKIIQEKFEKEGFTVSEVSLVRESDYKLTGFAKMNLKVLPLAAVTKNCTAIKDPHSGTSIWECK